MEEEEIQEVEQSIQSLTDDLANKIKKISTQSTKIGWLYDGLFKGSSSKAKLFNHEYNETKIPPSFQSSNTYKFVEAVYVQQISIYSTNAAAEVAVEIQTANSSKWLPIKLTKSDNDDYQYKILRQAIVAMRVRSTKKYGNSKRSDSITAIHILGCPLQILYKSAKTLNSKIDQLSEIKTTLDYIEEYYDDLTPSITDLETKKSKIEGKIQDLSLSEEQKQKVFNEFTEQQGTTDRLQQTSKNLQKEIVDKREELSKLRSEASQFSPDLEGHNKTITYHGLIFIFITFFSSIILGLLLSLVVYPELSTVYDTYIDAVATGKNIDYKALISLKAFYGLFGLVILISIEEVARRSLKAALNLMDESREINATNVLVNTLVESAANESNLTPDQVFNEQIKAKMQAFQGTRYKYLQSLSIEKKGMIDTVKELFSGSPSNRSQKQDDEAA